MADHLGVIADASAKAVFTTFVVLLVGVLLAFANKVDRAGVSVISTTANYIFVPALLFHVFASSLSVGAFSYAWSAVVVGVVAIPVSGVIAWLVAVLIRVEPYFKEFFIFGVSFSNTVALPLVFSASICSTVSFANIDNDGRVVLKPNSTEADVLSPTDCNTRGVLYIFLYIFVNSLIFWIIAFDFMPVTMDVPPPSSQDVSQESTPVRDDDETAVAPRPVSSSTQPPPSEPPPSEPPPLVRGDFAAGSFMMGPADQERDRRRRRLQVVNAYVDALPAPVKRAVTRCWLLFIRPPILSQLLGMLVGLCAPLQSALYAPTSVLQPVAQTIILFAAGGTSVTNLSLAAGLGIKLKEINWRHLFGGAPGGLSRKTTFAFVVTVRDAERERDSRRRSRVAHDRHPRRALLAHLARAALAAARQAPHDDPVH